MSTDSFWHYQAVRRKWKDGTMWLQVHEVYDLDAEGIVKTMEGIRPGGETRDELIEQLQMMIKDVAEFPVWDDDDEGRDE